MGWSAAKVGHFCAAGRPLNGEGRREEGRREEVREGRMEGRIKREGGGMGEIGKDGRESMKGGRKESKAAN